jgi:hypothetical protein
MTPNILRARRVSDVLRARQKQTFKQACTHLSGLCEAVLDALLDVEAR